MRKSRKLRKSETVSADGSELSLLFEEMGS